MVRMYAGDKLENTVMEGEPEAGAHWAAAAPSRETRAEQYGAERADLTQSGSAVEEVLGLLRAEAAGWTEASHGRDGMAAW